ncbi:MAG: lycopene cyclase domain-containing protein [Flavobacteriales bacterium]|nr:lycopene cyclase domain-containing protein [Flavobacteriales bacterium]
MDLGHYTYLALNIATLFFPLILSFDKKVAFYKMWGTLIPAILITAAVFIPWDMWKTSLGVWSFNPDYILGIFIGNLPIEEWLFFITVPYAILFVYECLKAYTPDILQPFGKKISKGVFVVLLFITVFFTDRTYTVITFPFAALFLVVHHLWLKNNIAGRFWVAYLVHLIPFFLVNGILTSLPVVMYNPSEYIGLRIMSVPVEDSVYSLLLFLMNVTLHEGFMQRKKAH